MLLCATIGALGRCGGVSVLSLPDKVEGEGRCGQGRNGGEQRLGPRRTPASGEELERSGRPKGERGRGRQSREQGSLTAVRA